MRSREIDEFIIDVNQVGQHIKSIDELITKMESKDLRDHYRSQMLDLIEQYNIMCEILEKQINKFIDDERKNGNNIESLYYNKILKTLKN